MPQCLTREVQVGLSHAVGVRSDGTFHHTQSGTFDPDILCHPCDNQLGVLEQRAASALQGIRAAAIEQPLGSVTSVQADTQQMLRFYAGLLWKYGVTKREFGRIRLGPYLSRIQEIAFGEAPIPDYFDAVLFRLRVHDADDQPFAYRAPSPDRKHGANMYRIFAGGVLAFIKVDQRIVRAPELQPLWLSGSSEVRALVAPAQRFEEFRMPGQAIANNPRLDRFLDRQETLGRSRSSTAA
jgi:hypothetical protein